MMLLLYLLRVPPPHFSHDARAARYIPVTNGTVQIACTRRVSLARLRLTGSIFTRTQGVARPRFMLVSSLTPCTYCRTYLHQHASLGLPWYVRTLFPFLPSARGESAASHEHGRGNGQTHVLDRRWEQLRAPDSRVHT